jgi:hypothetical protein
MPYNILRTLSDDDLAEREMDVRFDRSGPMDDESRARISAIVAEMRRRNAAAGTPIFEGL